MIVQSSSATISVLQNFAAQAGPDGVTSIIGLAGAIPILLGNNIGTTITALLASVGQSKNAKRTAIAHTVFNLTGSVLFQMCIRDSICTVLCDGTGVCNGLRAAFPPFQKETDTAVLIALQLCLQISLCVSSCLLYTSRCV